VPLFLEIPKPDGGVRNLGIPSGKMLRNPACTIPFGLLWSASGRLPGAVQRGRGQPCAQEETSPGHYCLEQTATSNICVGTGLCFRLGETFTVVPATDYMHGVNWTACMHGVADEATLIARIAAANTASWDRSWLCPRTRLESGGATESSAFRQPQEHCLGELPSNNRPKVRSRRARSS
jgi:hypothetical protein